MWKQRATTKICLLLARHHLLDYYPLYLGSPAIRKNFDPWLFGPVFRRVCLSQGCTSSVADFQSEIK